MAANKRRQDERHLKILRELGAQADNKQCFDCHQRGPTYIDMTTGSFVCTSCSGILRGLNPPHRVKSISMTSFTPEEIDFVKSRGNETCRRIWLGTYDPATTPEADSKDEQRIKDFLVQKYERKRWYVDPGVAAKRRSSAAPDATPEVESPTSVPPRRTSLATTRADQVTETSASGTRARSGASFGSAVRVLPQVNDGVSRVDLVAGRAPPPRPSLDLLDELVADPFAASATPSNATVDHANADFANFDDFNVGPSNPPSVGGTPMSTASSAGSQFGCFPSVASPGAAEPTPLGGRPDASSASLPSAAGPVRDKYAALADLDNLFNYATNANATPEWEGMKNDGSSWPVNGASPSAFASAGSTPTNATGGIPGMGNPFSATPQPTAWPPSQPRRPPFSTGNPFATSGFAPQQQHQHQQQQQQPQQPQSHASFGPFGRSPVTSPPGYATPNGRPPSLPSWGVSAHGPWADFGTTSPPRPLYASTPGAFGGGKTTASGTPSDAWQPNVGNPFLGGAVPMPPRSHSSNPFL